MYLYVKKIFSSLVLISVLLLLAVGLEFLSPYTLFEQDNVTVWVFDIGQGDAIFIQSPQAQILIDGGPDKSIVEKMEAILPFWDRSIDYMINTHPHADHVTGLVHMLDYYTVGTVLTTGQKYGTSVYNFFQEEIHQEYIQAGQIIDLGEGASLEIIWPEKSLENRRLNDPNAGSIVAVLHYGDSSMLLTGDSGVEEEHEFLAYVEDADVLKVGHQGSDTSTSNALLDKIRPEHAIISVGKNDYGHPHVEVLNRLIHAGSEIWRTDVHDDIRVEMYMNTISVSSHRLGID